MAKKTDIVKETVNAMMKAGEAVLQETKGQAPGKAHEAAVKANTLPPTFHSDYINLLMKPDIWYALSTKYLEF